MTQIQGAVIALLAELQFEHIPGPKGIMGGPSQWKVGLGTFEHLKELLGKTITVEPNGATTIT